VRTGASYGGRDPAELAHDAWDVLWREATRASHGRLRVLDGPGGRTAPLWPLVHVLWAAADLHSLGRDVPIAALATLLATYRRADAYAVGPRSRERYFDDNAWLGLACLRLEEVTADAAWRRRAERLTAFVATGEHPRGGIRWAEGAESRNACSTSSAAWLALEIGSDGDAATRCVDWVERRLHRADGLIADRLEDGHVYRRVWSYNQGATAAALRLLGRDPGPLAEATAGWFTPARLWREPPAFLAIADRGFDDTMPRAWLDPYLERLVTEARDPRTGWYVRGGVGSYDGHPTIDQAAVVQLFARRAAQQP
jgi:glycosyl hydrolase family 76